MSPWGEEVFGAVTEMRSTSRPTGWNGGGSDRFYRVYRVGATVLFHWGRWGAVGEFQSVTSLNEDTARELASAEVTSKVCDGYRILVDNENRALHIFILNKMFPAGPPAAPTAPAAPAKAKPPVLTMLDADVDRLVRHLSAADPDLAPALVAHTSLIDRLAALRDELLDTEGRLEAATGLLVSKLG